MTQVSEVEVTLRGMTFHTLIGVLPHEREHPQPVEVDLTASVRTGDVLDYRDLYADVRSAVDARTHGYLEHLVEDIATRTLRHASVRRVRVTARKPHAFVGGPIRHAEVSVVRDRETP